MNGKVFELHPLNNGKGEAEGRIWTLTNLNLQWVQEELGEREDSKTSALPSRLVNRPSGHWATDTETYWKKEDHHLTDPPPILSVLKVPSSPVFFVRPLATLELLSIWFVLRCFGWEEAGGCFLLHLCLHFYSQDKSRWLRHSETLQLSVFWSPLLQELLAGSWLWWWRSGPRLLLGSVEACWGSLKGCTGEQG